MPRTADHDQRRAQIADAAFGLIAYTGLDTATMAAVAREAGMSVGLVQHYFGSKDDLLLFTYRRTMEGLLTKAAALVAEGESARRTIADILLTCVQELLPFDERRRAEYRVSRAFLSRSLDSPTIAEVARETAAHLRSQIALSVDNGKHCGEVAPGTDVELAAFRITALVDGLADQVYREPDRSIGGRPLHHAAVEVLRSTLAEVFPGECRRYERAGT